MRVKLSKHSLKYKILSLFFVINFVLIGTLLGLAVYLKLSHEKLNRHMEDVRTLSTLASRIYETQKQLEINVLHHRFNPDPTHIERIQAQSQSIDEIVENMEVIPLTNSDKELKDAYVRARGEVLAAQGELLTSIEAAPEEEVGENFEKWLSTAQHRNTAIENLKNQSIKRSEELLGMYNGFMDRFEWGLLIMSLITVIGAYVLYKYLNITLVNPLTKLSQSALTVTEGNFVQFPEVQSNKELLDLSKSLNLMVGSMQANYDRLKTEIEEKEIMIRRNKELEKRKDDFISMASHELKTPITSLSVFTQIIEKKAEEAQNTCILKYSTAMRAQLDRLRVLVNELLDISNIRVGKLELVKGKVDLSQLVIEVSDTLEQVISTHRLKVSVCKCPPVIADRERIGHVLINLISNAVKYSPLNTQVIVKVEHVGNEVIVSVRDFGIGIAKEYQERIFERFFRVYDRNERTFPGLGIGLYVSYIIIRKHNGRIWVDSLPGKGSTFYFALPVGY